MQPDVGAAVSWLRSRSYLAPLAFIVAAALAATFLPENALAQCAGGSACVERQGTDSTSVESDQNLQGGDGVAGGQVIGVGEGSGDVRIDADNDSRFSNADGGDVESKVDMEGESSSGTVVEGSNVQVTADSSNSVNINQSANPQNQIAGEFAPLAPATGESVFSGTATTPVDQDADVGQSPDIDSIAAPARAMATVIDEGDRRVVLSSEGSATSGDAIAGGQVIAVIATTGETTIIATNRSVFANAKGGDAEAEIDLSAAEEAGLSVAPSNTSLETSVGGAAVVGQTASPQASIVADGDGEVQAAAEAGVVQSATLESSPAVLTASGEQTTSGAVIQRGDVVAEQEVDLGVTGGDAIAGGQVIGLSGVEGNVTIAASNNSRHATARGGDAQSNVNSTATAAPRVSLDGGNSAVQTGATATVEAEQSAAPEVRLSVSQTSGGTGPSTDAGTTPGNVGTATGSANVQQTASTTSSPTIINRLSAQP
jgi:hypothetical protein